MPASRSLTPAGHGVLRAKIPAMRIAMRPVVIGIVLALWIVLGPVAMAFDGCLLMGGMCEAPCGMLSYIVAPSSGGLALLQPLAYLASRSAQHFALVSARPPTPPPKSALLSA